jgi:hypothetical protein
MPLCWWWPGRAGVLERRVAIRNLYGLSDKRRRWCGLVNSRKWRNVHRLQEPAEQVSRGRAAPTLAEQVANREPEEPEDNS